MMKFMMMMTVMQGFNQGSSHNYGRHKCAHGGAGGCKDHDQYEEHYSFDDDQDMRDMMDKMRMMTMMMKFMMMMTVMQGFNQGSSHNYGRHKCAHGGAGGCKDHDQYMDNFSFDDNQDMRDMMDKMRMM